MTDDTPASPPPSPVVALLGSINDAALQYAKRWKLIDEHGNIQCSICSYRAGTLPSFACEGCLEEYRRGRRTGL